MPTIALARDDIFERLGRVYTDHEFDELCFSFGIELDDVMTEEAARELRGTGSGGAEATLGSGGAAAASRVLYYIAIPANRYDLLCLEGLTRALNVFLQRIPPPVRGAGRPARAPMFERG
jgi:phenylalanyl-tRNA synthetase beta chain